MLILIIFYHSQFNLLFLKKHKYYEPIYKKFFFLVDEDTNRTKKWLRNNIHKTLTTRPAQMYSRINATYVKV